MTEYQWQTCRDVFNEEAIDRSALTGVLLTEVLPGFYQGGGPGQIFFL